MKFNWKQISVLFAIILISVTLRFYQLDKLPPGLIIDEASEGYNAFSLLHTGKDRYGQSFPILFRSFGSFQAPLYTYLSVVPAYLFGNTIFSIHFVSAVFGVMLTVITLIIFADFENKRRIGLAVLTALLVAISPWAVFFSRFGTEASVGVALLVLSFLFFYLSLKQIWFFPVATFILGLSTHAYYSERLISIFFLFGFILLFRKSLLLKKKILILGLICFALTQIPHLMILNSGAFTRRINQVDYFNDYFFQENGGDLRYIPLGKPIYIIKEFLSQYLTYLSPKNLFFDPDPQDFRTIPNFSVFYGWMIIPFVFGLRILIRKRSLPLVKMIILLLATSPIPASLTRDPFSTIRILVFLWGITIVIAFGIHYLFDNFSTFRFRVALFIFVILISLIQLYIAYFVLLKYERSNEYSFSYIELLKKTEQMHDKKFVVDSTRELGIGIRFAFFKRYDPLKMQEILGNQIKDSYYSSFEFDEPYLLDNVEARPIIWTEDVCENQILVGDQLAISDNQVKEHYLKFLFDIKDMAGNVSLKAYSTDPIRKCSAPNFKEKEQKEFRNG